MKSRAVLDPCGSEARGSGRGGRSACPAWPALHDQFHDLSCEQTAERAGEREGEREGERPDRKRRRRGEVMHHLFAAPLLGTNGRSPSSSERSDDPTSRRPSAPAHRPTGERKASMEVYVR